MRLHSHVVNLHFVSLVQFFKKYWNFWHIHTNILGFCQTGLYIHSNPRASMYVVLVMFHVCMWTRVHVCMYVACMYVALVMFQLGVLRTVTYKGEGGETSETVTKWLQCNFLVSSTATASICSGEDDDVTVVLCFLLLRLHSPSSCKRIDSFFRQCLQN